LFSATVDQVFDARLLLIAHSVSCETVGAKEKGGDYSVLWRVYP